MHMSTATYNNLIAANEWSDDVEKPDKEDLKLPVLSAQIEDLKKLIGCTSSKLTYQNGGHNKDWKKS